VVADRFAAVVRETGATVVPYRSRFPARVPPVRDADDLAEVLAAYLWEAVAGLPAAWTAFADDPPHVVVEDALSTAAGRLVAERCAAPVVRAFVGFAGNDEVRLNGTGPPSAADALDPAHPAFAALARDIPALVRPLGLDPERVGHALTGPSGALAASLVFVPKAFQPRPECFDDSFLFVGPGFVGPGFVGPGFVGPGFVGPGFEQPARAVPTASWRRPARSSRVALVSLGTSCPPNPAFFAACAEAFAGSDWHLVMTAKGHLVPAEAAALPGSVEVHDWLDYDAVLPAVDLVICQGGTGSLMDAFRAGRPVLVAPQTPDAEPIADQVARLGLGGRLPTTPTGAQVRALADAVLDDPCVPGRVAAMRTAIRDAGGPARAADELLRIAALAARHQPIG
jgi:hypothetical protein